MKTLPQTLVRVGRFDKPLKDAATRSHERLEPAKFGLGNTTKYATFSQGSPHYLLMVSQQKAKVRTAAGYNVILTVTSRSDEQNKEVVDRFESETKIPLDLSVPRALQLQMTMMGASFQAFESSPREARAVLRGAT